MVAVHELRRDGVAYVRGTMTGSEQNWLASSVNSDTALLVTSIFRMLCGGAGIGPGPAAV
eukprot:2129782-Rhodomonas_salina.2